MLKRVPSGLIDLVGGVLGRKRSSSSPGTKVSDLHKLSSLDDPDVDEGVRRRVVSGGNSEPRLARKESGGNRADGEGMRALRVVKAS